MDQHKKIIYIFFTIKYHILFTEQYLWVYNHICSWTRISQNVENKWNLFKNTIEICNHKSPWSIISMLNGVLIHPSFPQCSATLKSRHDSQTQLFNKRLGSYTQKHVCLPPKIPPVLNLIKTWCVINKFHSNTHKHVNKTLAICMRLWKPGWFQLLFLVAISHRIMSEGTKCTLSFSFCISTSANKLEIKKDRHHWAVYMIRSCWPHKAKKK